MTNHNEHLLAWLQRFQQYRQAREILGYRHREIARLHEALACSGLPSAGRGMADAESLLMQEAVTDLLNPSCATSVVPPVPAGEDVLIVGHELTTNAPCWIRYSEVCLGWVTCGAPGCGKTHLLASTIQGVSAKKEVYIHAPDAKKEIYRIFRKIGRRFLYAKPSQVYTNILECPVRDAMQFYSGLMEYMGHLLGIDEATWPEIAAMLTQIRIALPKDRPMPSLVEFIAFLRRTGTKTKRSKYHTAASKFLVLAIGYGEVAQVRRGPSLHSRYSAIGMDYTGVSHAIRHATEFLALYHFTQVESESGHDAGKLRLFVPVDEGLDIWGRSYATPEGAGNVSFQDTTAAQGRSYGMGRMVNLQFIRQGMDAAFNNSGIIIVMRLPNPMEAKLATRYLGIPEEMERVIQGLPLREAFIKTPSYPAVRMRTVESILEAYPSAAEIDVAMEPEVRWMRVNSVISPLSLTNGPLEMDYADILAVDNPPVQLPASSSTRNAPNKAEPVRQLLDDWRELLLEVLAHPEEGVANHYRALSWGVSRGHRTRHELIDAQLLSEEQAPPKSGRPVTRLAVTALGTRSLEAMKRHEARS